MPLTISLQVYLPDVSEAQARDAVRALDELDAGVADAIHRDKVKAEHVLEALFSGRWNPNYAVINDTMSDA